MEDTSAEFVPMQLLDPIEAHIIIYKHGKTSARFGGDDEQWNVKIAEARRIYEALGEALAEADKNA